MSYRTKAGFRRIKILLRLRFFCPYYFILRVKIAIVEDHLMFREVLRKICTVELQHTIVGEAEDGRRAVELVAATNPELVLLDLHLPKLDGFGVAEAIRLQAPDIRILVLSSHCDEYTVYRSERLRVHGFIDKNSNSIDTLKQAIKQVAQGKTAFSTEFQKIKAARSKNPLSFDKVLTGRELTVLPLVGASLTDAQIAAHLRIAETTVEKHRFNLMKKLGLRTTAELVRYARDHGFMLLAPKSDSDVMLP